MRPVLRDQGAKDGPVRVVDAARNAPQAVQKVAAVDGLHLVAAGKGRRGDQVGVLAEGLILRLFGEAADDPSVAEYDAGDPGGRTAARGEFTADVQVHRPIEFQHAIALWREVLVDFGGLEVGDGGVGEAAQVLRFHGPFLQRGDQVMRTRDNVPGLRVIQLRRREIPYVHRTFRPSPFRPSKRSWKHETVAGERSRAHEPNRHARPKEQFPR